MDKLFENKLVWIAGLLVLFNVVFFVGSNVILDKVADSVIEKLEKEYSPSPYGPGFDPDKVTPETIRRRALLQDYIESKQGEKVLFHEDALSMKVADVWRSEWEEERGFSPGQ